MKKYFILKLTAEECISVQNLLERAYSNSDVIAARQAIMDLLNKFRDAKQELED